MAFKIDTKDLIPHMSLLKRFMPDHQRNLVGGLIRNREEGDFFREKIVELSERIKAMPKSYDQASLGDKAVAHLHYFGGGFDAWITEKDSEEEQYQAMALVKMHGGDPELGYVSLVEMMPSNIELDLHFTPTTIGEIKKSLGIEPDYDDEESMSP